MEKSYKMREMSEIKKEKKTKWKDNESQINYLCTKKSKQYQEKFDPITGKR